uniref:Uncharacterized protein n=1 Tax=Panagrolaimus davidi TaxID=227884 RepID=A0A914R5A8_9BILA
MNNTNRIQMNSKFIQLIVFDKNQKVSEFQRCKICINKLTQQLILTPYEKDEIIIDFKRSFVERGVETYGAIFQNQKKCRNLLIQTNVDKTIIKKFMDTRNKSDEARIRDKWIQKLIIFDVNDRSLCYEYTWSRKFFQCKPCQHNHNIHVQARIIKNCLKGEYVELGQNQHKCIPIKYVPEDLNIKIVKKPYFFLEDVTNKNGTISKRLNVSDGGANTQQQHSSTIPIQTPPSSALPLIHRPPLPERFKKFCILYHTSTDRDWSEAKCKRMFGQLLQIPIYSQRKRCSEPTKCWKYLCFFCVWRGNKEDLFKHLREKHCCGKSLEKNLCHQYCMCPIPINEREVREHEQNRCFKINWEEGIYELLAVIGDNDEFDINAIFDSFRNRTV